MRRQPVHAVRPRQFHRLIERDRALKAAFLPEVREFISQGVLISGWLSPRRGAVAPGPPTWAGRCAILRDTLRDIVRYFSIYLGDKSDSAKGKANIEM